MKILRRTFRVMVLGTLALALGCRSTGRSQPQSVPRPAEVHTASWWQLPDRARALTLTRIGRPRSPMAHRNLFDFGMAPVEHIQQTPPVEEPTTSTTDRVPEPGPAPVETPTPAAAPSPEWRLMGIVRAQNGEPRFAVLFDGTQWRVVYEDLVLGPGIRVKAIEDNAVVLERRQGDQIQDLRVTFERG